MNLHRFALICLSICLVFALALLGMVPPAAAAAADSYGDFIRAVRTGNEPEVRRQIAAGTQVNIPQNLREAQPLYHALEARQFAMARLLVEGGADLNANDESGEFPLRWAARAGDAEFVRFLLARGPRGQAGDRQGRFAAADAIVWDRLEVLEVLVQAGVGVRNLGIDETALGLACRQGSLRCAGYLLDHGADPNEFSAGNTPLTLAAYLGKRALIELLIARGADVNRVSRGRPPIDGYEPFPHTPLLMAVLQIEPENVALLLKAGAKPDALDNHAIILADLLGDEESFRLLRAAGASDPGPHPYAAWARAAGFGAPVARSGGAAGASPAESPTFRPAPADVEGGTALPREVTFAVINLRDRPAVADVEALLAASLSQVEKAIVLERGELRRTLRERALQGGLGQSPVGNARTGRMLGADVLVLLDTQKIEKREAVEARIVDVATGLVIDTSLTTLEPETFPGWVREVRGRCVGGAARLLTRPGEARLVAVSPVVASTNAPAARELERQVSLLLVHRLARSPRLVLVERSALDRLALEQAAGKPGGGFLPGSWRVEGGLEVPFDAADPGVTLDLVLHPGGGAGSRRVSVTGTRQDPRALVEAAVAQIARTLEIDPGRDAGGEAAALAVQAQALIERRLWEDASNAADAAWALGARADEDLRRRLEASVGRVLFSSRFLLAGKRARTETSGLVNLLSFRAPLTMPAEDEREFSMEGYFDEAERILDVFATLLARVGAAGFAGQPLSFWLLHPAWEAAAIPLKFSESLSSKREYTVELAGLRARLAAVHARALAMAEAAGDTTLVQSLVVLRCKYLPWWLPDVAAFEEEALQVLAQWRNAEPPRSEHAVWGGLHEIARARVGRIGGRSAQAWVRLARRLAASEDPGEHFLGVALTAADLQSLPAKDAALRLLRESFPALVEQDRSIPGSVARAAFSDGPESPWDRPLFTAWYAGVLERGVAPGRWRNEEIGFLENPFSTAPLFSDGRSFWLGGLRRRLALLGESGRGGFFQLRALEPSAPLEEGTDIAALVRRAAERCRAEVTAGEYPRNSYEPLFRLERRLPAGNPAAAFLVLAGPRMPLGEAYRKASASISRPDLAVNPGPVVLGESEAWLYVYDGLEERRGLAALDREGRVTAMLYPPDESYDFDFHQADANAHWLAGVTGDCSLAVLDRLTGVWRRLAVFEDNTSVRGMILRGNRAFLSFEHSPQVARDAWRDRNTVEDALRGVLEVDLVSGQKSLLVSNLRRPARSPLDGFAGRYEGFVKTGATGFFLEGGPPFIRDTVAEAWREDSITGRNQAARVQRDRFLPEAEGKRWEVAVWGVSPVLRVANAADSREVMEIPFAFEHGDQEWLRRRPELSAVREQRRRGGSVPLGALVPGGVVIQDGFFYFWLSEPELADLIRRWKRREETGPGSSRP